MNVVLIGYRGSGKTTVGKKLARQLWKKFVDVDEQVCHHFGGKTIRQIWQGDGEPAFRAKECSVAAELLAADEQVIALGGGTVMHDEGRRAVEQATGAVRIYLKCKAQELYRRISDDPTRPATRPSSASVTLDQIKASLADREPVYEAVADHVFDVSLMGPDELVRYLIQRCL